MNTVDYCYKKNSSEASNATVASIYEYNYNADQMQHQYNNSTKRLKCKIINGLMVTRHGTNMQV